MRSGAHSVCRCREIQNQNLRFFVLWRTHHSGFVSGESERQPLLFEKVTIFPWGLRRKKYELLPYEIYQTNNREIAFLRYDYTKDHINAASYKLVYRGQMECWQTLDSLYCLHNQENRPNGRKMRSLSVSDIIVTHEGGEAHAYYVEPIGYKQVDDLLPGLEQTKKRSVVREER